MKRLLVILMVAMLFIVGCSKENSGNDIPSSVEVQVPARAGGGTDVMARTLGQEVAQQSDSNFAIVNNVDGGGVVAMETVRNAKADGSQILQFHSSMLVKTATNVYDKRAAEDFTVIGVSRGTEKGSYVLVVSKDSGYETLEDFINAAKEVPGELLLGVETGGMSHILGGLLTQTTGADVQYVEAGSDTDKLTMLVGNNIDACFVNPNQAKQYVEADTVIALGTVSTDIEGGRSSVLPDVESFVEQGYELIFANINLFLGPKDMDEELVKKLYDLYSEAAKTDAVNDVLGPAGMSMEFFSFEEGPDIIKEQQEVLDKVVKDLGLDK